MRPCVAVEGRAKAGSGLGEIVTMLSSRKQYLTPALLRRLYKTSSFVPVAADQNVLGIVGYNEEYPSPQDLEI